MFIIKLAAIVTLDGKNGKVELSTSIGMKSSKGNKGIRFFAKRKGPKIISIIIHNNKIVAKTRGTRNR